MTANFKDGKVPTFAKSLKQKASAGALAGVEGVHSSRNSNDLRCQLAVTARADNKSIFRRLSTERTEPRGSVFVLTLQARPGVAGVRALKWLLKVLSRQHGFRCLDVREDDKRRGRR